MILFCNLDTTAYILTTDPLLAIFQRNLGLTVGYPSGVKLIVQLQIVLAFLAELFFLLVGEALEVAISSPYSYPSTFIARKGDENVCDIM